MLQMRGFETKLAHSLSDFNYFFNEIQQARVKDVHKCGSSLISTYVFILCRFWGLTSTPF